MKFRFLSALSINFLLTISCLSNVAHAGVIFFDDFDDGSLMNNPHYASNTNGIITTDPLEGDSALTFDGTAGGSDLNSVLLTSHTGNVFLSFDYLGTCGNLLNGCGGYLDLPQSGKGWIGTGVPHNGWGFTLEDDNEWHHYEVSFIATNFTFTIEDWSGAGGNVAGDAYFDNIRFSDDGFAASATIPEPSTLVPEPSTLAIFALGLMGLASRRFNKQS